MNYERCDLHGHALCSLGKTLQGEFRYGRWYKMVSLLPTSHPGKFHTQVFWSASLPSLETQMFKFVAPTKGKINPIWIWPGNLNRHLYILVLNIFSFQKSLWSSFLQNLNMLIFSPDLGLYFYLCYGTVFKTKKCWQEKNKAFSFECLEFRVLWFISSFSKSWEYFKEVK